MATLSETRLPAGHTRSSGMIFLLPDLASTCTLTAIAPRQFVGDAVQYIPFLRTPRWRKQDVGRCGAGDAVVHHFPWRALDQIGGDLRVIRLGQRHVVATLPLDREPGVLHHVQRMQLEPVDPDVEHT